MTRRVEIAHGIERQIRPVSDILARPLGHRALCSETGIEHAASHWAGRNPSPLSRSAGACALTLASMQHLEVSAAARLAHLA